MFTGLVEELGHVQRLQRQGSLQRMDIAAQKVLEGMAIGDSVNIDGACQTVVAFDAHSFSVETVPETLSRTTLGKFQSGRTVNLERAMRLGDRLGGHIVQGHVDEVGQVTTIEQSGGEWRIRISTPASLHPYIAGKGSITVDGISLTVAEVDAGGFTIAVIPHTFDNTVLSQRSIGDDVNLEVDVIARYIERLLHAGSDPRAAMSFDKLREMGY